MMSGKVFIPKIELSLGDVVVVAVLVSFLNQMVVRDQGSQGPGGLLRRIMCDCS